MLTRRRFLGYSGAGILALTAGCRPSPLEGLLNPDETASRVNLTPADK
ncbi:MAG: twin-arginine translocation signal domain-containing protein, partial [Gammaproteobacteria bacterium]